MDLNVSPPAQISLDDIAAWESKHGAVPQGAVVAIRHSTATSDRALDCHADQQRGVSSLWTPATQPASQSKAAQTSLRTARSPARSRSTGNYVIESTAHLTTLPPNGSIIIVAPSKGKNARQDQVRVLAMVR